MRKRGRAAQAAAPFLAREEAMSTNDEAIRNRAPFAEGDTAMVYDRRNRRYRITLAPGALIETHLGYARHDDALGRREGFFLVTNKGHRLFVARPSFADAVKELPRQSQVIYPKDLAALLFHADIYPGARVIEVGLGSGAASSALLRAIGPEGSLVTYEVRAEIIEASRRNVSELAPGAENHRIVVADAYAEGVGDSESDRLVADVPEPWRLLAAAADALRTGGVFAAYLPTVLQTHEFVMRLSRDSRWHMPETVELLERNWRFSETSARPDHRMVGHTGFITTARRTEPPPAYEGPEA